MPRIRSTQLLRHDFRPKRLSGFVTLMVILTLLIGLTTVSLMTGRSSILEQSIAGNDKRSAEVKETAEAALEYFSAWVSANPLPWQNATDALLVCPADMNCPTLPNSFSGNDTGAITVNARFERNPASPNFIKVSVNASQADNNSKASFSQWINQEGVRIPGTWRDF